jgi:Prion-inhibition and propagation
MMDSAILASAGSGATGKADLTRQTSYLPCPQIRADIPLQPSFNSLNICYLAIISHLSLIQFDFHRSCLGSKDMAEAIGLTMGAMSLASLFSTCVECFGYFSASKDFERDRNILLVRLDFERNKLLIWGNSVGVLRETGDGLLKALGRGKDTHQKSRQQLECIISILTDAEKLQETYGVRGSEGQRKESISWSLVSKNNLDLFKLTLKRFLLRNPKEAAEYRKYKIWAKLKWAIHDKQKFQGLINDLKELVDQLFLIQLNSKLLVNPGQLDASMKTDIELIDNVGQLRLVQEACEDSYRAWSDHAGSVIAASENGTTDRRTFEEISKDVYIGDSEIAIRTPAVEHEKSGNVKLF